LGEVGAGEVGAGEVGAGEVGIRAGGNGMTVGWVAWGMRAGPFRPLGKPQCTRCHLCCNKTSVRTEGW
jgi:hypothetical protein